VPEVKGAHAALGAEVFVSALDTIIEIAHKSRNKAGWMHPSVNGRIALVRDLATSPPAAARFDREMVWTRVVIACVFVVGAAACGWVNFFGPPPRHASGKSAGPNSPAALIRPAAVAP
jgi:hypothetical protein